MNTNENQKDTQTPRRLTKKQAKQVKRELKRQRKQEKFDAKWEKKKRRHKSFPRKLWIFTKILFLLALITIATALWYGNHKYGDLVREAYSNAQEKIESLDMTIFLGKESTKIYDKDNNLLTELVTHEFDYLPFDEIPDNVKYAIIAIEDERFLEHDGVDYRAIARAAYDIYKNKGKITQGGSTITQQLVKNSLLTQDKLYSRKLEEVFIARELEKTLPKTQILEYYLNNIYFGHGASGIESASSYYFSKPSKELTLEETAFLLAIPNNPSIYDPIRNKDNTLKRQQRILKKMQEQGYITEQEFTTATLAPIELNIKERIIPPETYLVSYAISDATKQLMKANGFETKTDFDSKEEQEEYIQAYNEAFTKYNQDIRSGGYIIKTSLDQTIQNQAQETINKEMAYSKTKNPETNLYTRQAASVIIDNKTGLVKAIVGGRTQPDTPNTFNRGFLMHRQPGSAIKPVLVYTQALEYKYFPTSTVTDKPIENGPKNVTNSYIGTTTIEYAVIKSINTIPYQLIQERGIKDSLNYLKQMNFSRIDPRDEIAVSAIGGMTYGVSPLELASAFSTLSRNGEFIEPTSILTIQRINKEVIYKHQPTHKQVFDPGASYLMTQILQKTAENKGKSGLSGVIENQVTATKTGTTNDIRDVWYAGYTPYYTTVVWVGEDTPKRMNNKTSYDDPLNIWHNIMTTLHKTLPPTTEFAQVPNSLTKGYVDPKTGRLSRLYKRGWREELIPTSRFKKQDEADAELKHKQEEKAREEAKKREEEAKEREAERKRQEELKRKEDEKLDALLKAQGSSLKEEQSKVSQITDQLKTLKGYQIYDPSHYDKADQLIETAQTAIYDLVHVDNQVNYQNQLNVEIARLTDQKDQVERKIIFEQEEAERQAIREEEERLKAEERKRLQEELEKETQAEKERLEQLEREQKEKEEREKAEKDKNQNKNEDSSLDEEDSNSDE